MKAGIVGLVAICAFVATPAVAFAQAPPPPGGTYPGGGPAAPAGQVRQGIVAKGVKLAVNAGGLHGADVEDIDDEQGRRIGFGLGGYVVYALNDQLAAQIELLYMQKGATFDAGDDTLKFDYIEVPILGRFDLGQPGGGMRPYLVGGFGIALNVLGEIESGGETLELDCVAGNDVLAHVGGGATIPSGAAAISLELRLSVGLISTVEDSDRCSGGEINNNVISAFAGYQF